VLLASFLARIHSSLSLIWFFFPSWVVDCEDWIPSCLFMVGTQAAAILRASVVACSTVVVPRLVYFRYKEERKNKAPPSLLCRHCSSQRVFGSGPWVHGARILRLLGLSSQKHPSISLPFLRAAASCLKICDRRPEACGCTSATHYLRNRQPDTTWRSATAFENCIVIWLISVVICELFALCYMLLCTS